MHRIPKPVLSPRMRLIASLAGVLLACLFVGAAAADERQVPRFIQFSIQDPGGNFFPQGEIEFCTEGGRCVYADIQEGFPGNFYLPAEELHPDTLYTVMIYDPNVKVLWEMRDWTFEPKKYDAKWNRWLSANKFLIFPRFFVHPDRSMTFEIETTLNPEWERLMRASSAIAGPDTLPDYPRFQLAVEGPVLLSGRFGSDAEAAGGVLAVKAGVGIEGSFRFRFPKKIPRYGWFGFREISVGYAQNRYDTEAIMTPGRGSDVTYHRYWLAGGIGRLSASMSSQWNAGVLLGRGAVLDGNRALEYLGRTYRMFGVGVYARASHAVWSGDRASLGLMGRVGMTYTFAGEGDEDFWYGWEPSLSAGLVVY